MISNLIGVGGATRKGMEEETGARLKISHRDEFFPNSSCRILIISADSVDQLLSVVEQVLVKLVETVEKEQERGGKGARPEEADTMVGKEPGEYVFRTALPNTCTGRLIGPRGASIKALREDTGAKVFVENETYDGHQMVRVIGPQEAILTALKQVVEIIDLEMGGDRLMEWASVISFGPGKGGRSGGDRGKGGGEPRRGGDAYVNGSGAAEGGGRRTRSPSWDESRAPAFGEFDNDMPADAGPAELDERDAPGGTGPDHEAALEAMRELISQFPEGALDCAHAVSCDLPSHRVGALIGRKGEFVHHVQKVTGTTANFSEAPKGGEVKHRNLTIQGPLMAVYAAHMMMMKKYHEDEERERLSEERRERLDEERRERLDEQRRERPPLREEEDKIEMLQSQLKNLERQLQEAKGNGGAGGGGGGRPRNKGKGRR